MKVSSIFSNGKGTKKIVPLQAFKQVACWELQPYATSELWSDTPLLAEQENHYSTQWIFAIHSVHHISLDSYNSFMFQLQFYDLFAASIASAEVTRLFPSSGHQLLQRPSHCCTQVVIKLDLGDVFPLVQLLTTNAHIFRTSSTAHLYSGKTPAPSLQVQL